MAKNKRRKQPQKNLKARLSIFAAIMLLLSLIFAFSPQIYEFVNKKGFYDFKNATSQDVVFHFIDVGQGDAIAIQLPDGKTMLIDSGPQSSSDVLINYLNKHIFSTLKTKVLDYFIITHPHEDHIGGGVQVFAEFEVKHFYRPNVYTQTEAEELFVGQNNIYQTQVFNNLISASLAEEGLETVVFANYFLPKIKKQDYSFTFLSPNSFSYSNLNNYSPLILFEYADGKALFTGDAEKDVEKEVASIHEDMLKNIDVLKVGHHGSNTSSTQEFVSLINPKHAVFQVGQNSYGNPHAEVVQRFEKQGTNTLRNDLNGNVIIGFSNTDSIYCYVATNTSLPRAVEVWHIYLTCGVVVFYFTFIFDFNKLKPKQAKRKS